MQFLFRGGVDFNPHKNDEARLAISRLAGYGEGVSREDVNLLCVAPSPPLAIRRAVKGVGRFPSTNAADIEGRDPSRVRRSLLLSGICLVLVSLFRQRSEGCLRLLLYQAPPLLDSNSSLLSLVPLAHRFTSL